MSEVETKTETTTEAPETPAAATEPVAVEAEAAAEEAPAEPEAPAFPTVPSKVNIMTLKVDEEVTSWCGHSKCKGFRVHVVKTLQPPKPPKAVCTNCRAVHQVRLYEPGTKKKASDGPSMPEVAPWPELVLGINPDDATKYLITKDFQLDEFVMHKTFGLGKVIQIGTEHRARISFEVGIKWMLQNHQA
ncbi:MAG: hypothetical protein ACPGU1_11155 [Myxococcota bacterium]